MSVTQAVGNGMAHVAAPALSFIKDDLARVEAHIRALPGLQPEFLRQAVEIIVASGGKRVRPTIVLLVAGMLGYVRNTRVDFLAAAAEMLHTSSLVHDDLIDGALVRRGAATLNAAWTPAATVLTGDYLFAYAAGLAAKTDNVRVMHIFADTLGIIVGGELQQQFSDWARRSTRDDYYRRIYAKTGSLFVLATTAAGVLANCNEHQLENLRVYGHEMGNAFQVIDDILDFIGDQASVGKPVGSDLRRGLITLPTIAYAELNPADEALQCALAGECDPATYDVLVQKIRQSDAIALALAEAQTLAHKAKQALDDFPANEYRTALLQIADYTVSRSI